MASSDGVAATDDARLDLPQAESRAAREAQHEDGEMGAPALVLAFVALAAWALLLYRPWAPLPFEGQDFSEFLPLLRGGATFGERHAALTDYYASHGRYLPLTVLYTNLKWTLFGWNVQAWQWLNVLLMLGNVTLAYAFVRRVGASRAGALVAGALFVVGVATSAVWARVHYSEPQGLPFLVGASLLAAGLRGRDDWLRRALAVGTLMALAILVKETFVSALPFVVLLGASHEARGRWRAPRIDRRLVGFALVVGLACTLALIPVLLVKLAAPPQAYASRYSAATIGLASVVLTFRAMFLPMAESVRRVLPELAFVTVVAVGLAAAARRRIAGDVAWLVVTALSLPLCGALAYVSWPTYTARHAAPYALGHAMLLGVAVTWGLRERRAIRRATLVLLAYLAVYGTLRTREDVANFTRSRLAQMSVLRAIEQEARRAGTREILVPVANADAPCDACWLINDFGKAVLTAPLPPARPLSCADAVGALAQAAPSTIVAMQDGECTREPALRLPAFSTTTRLLEHRFTGRPGPAESLRTTLSRAGGERSAPY